MASFITVDIYLKHGIDALMEYFSDYNIVPNEDYVAIIKYLDSNKYHNIMLALLGNKYYNVSVEACIFLVNEVTKLEDEKLYLEILKYTKPYLAKRSYLIACCSNNNIKFFRMSLKLLKYDTGDVYAILLSMQSSYDNIFFKTAFEYLNISKRKFLIELLLNEFRNNPKQALALKIILENYKLSNSIYKSVAMAII